VPNDQTLKSSETFLFLCLGTIPERWAIASHLQIGGGIVETPAAQEREELCRQLVCCFRSGNRLIGGENPPCSGARGV